MRNPTDEYDRLHDHMTAIARERDHAVRTIDALTKQLEELKDALTLAHEALRRKCHEPSRLAGIGFNSAMRCLDGAI